MIRLTIWIILLPICLNAQRLRDLGIQPGVLSPGELNSITDVDGVLVGHETIIEGDSIRTGVTAILPHPGNIFQQKVGGAIYIGNGFGKLMGYSQVEELGFIETPIVLTNTLSVPTAANAVIKYTLGQSGNEEVRSVNAVVGETNDGYLNDIRGMHVKQRHVLNAIENATTGQVAEGNVGAGTGTICFGFKGGIGTSSRKLPDELGGYTIGVLVQTNFGGVLSVDGVPVGKELDQYVFKNKLNDSGDGSCIIVVATDAPLDSRNLNRLAKRAFLGLGRTGGIASNGSGDYVIAFTTNRSAGEDYGSDISINTRALLENSATSPLFLAAIEATEEAILNSLTSAESMTGHQGTIDALPIDRLKELIKKYR
ncbi:MAG: P1 family peptidase [Cyclobacteriaceae bacterium]